MSVPANGLRHAAVKGRDTFHMAEIIGKPGRLVEYRKSDLRIPDFQRNANEARIKRGAREFNWYLFGVLYVYTDGREPYVLDGRHRLGMALMRPDVEMLPCMGFDVTGHEHAAEIFVNLQRYRKPLVTRDLHNAELFAGGEFGHIARLAQEFVSGLDCETVPLASIRKLIATKTDAFNRVAPLVADLVGPAALVKDFIEAAVYLEDAMMHDGAGESLTDGRWRALLFDTGYAALVAMMQAIPRTGRDRAYR